MASSSDALGQLQSAAKEYIDAEKTRVKNEVDYLKAVKQRLGGSSTLRAANEDRLSVLLLDEINLFLSE